MILIKYSSDFHFHTASFGYGKEGTPPILSPGGTTEIIFFDGMNAQHPADRINRIFTTAAFPPPTIKKYSCYS